MTDRSTDLTFRIDEIDFEGGPQTVLEFSSASANISGFIVVDSLALGPATGGCRFTTYASPSEARRDAQRLARGMSFKNAMADLPLGGGKSVIVKPGGPFDRDLVFKIFGEALNHLHGAYLAAEDVGTSETDMERIERTSPFVFGLPKTGLKAGGNPSPRTAQGVFLSILALLDLKNIDVANAHIAIQGLGSVGLALAHLLLEKGARLSVADINDTVTGQLSAHPNVSVFDTNQIHRVEADIFAPCALGAGLNARTIPELGARIVAGAANNQLETPDDALRLASRGILYAPDFIVNAGGIINVACEYLGESEDQVDRRVSEIPNRLISLILQSELEHFTPSQAADMQAQRKISSAA